MVKRRSPEVLFLIAAVIGLIAGKLIKNFKVGVLLGIIIATLVAMWPVPKQTRNKPVERLKK